MEEVTAVFSWPDATSISVQLNYWKLRNHIFMPNIMLVLRVFLASSRIMTRQASQIFSLRNAGKHSWIGCALSSLVTISVQKAPQSKKYSGQLQVLLIKVLFVWRSRTISRLFTLTPTAQSSRLTLYHQSHFSDNSVSFWIFFCDSVACLVLVNI